METIKENIKILDQLIQEYGPDYTLKELRDELIDEIAVDEIQPENKYYRWVTDCCKTFYWVKSVQKNERLGDSVTYDCLEVIDYTKVSYSKDVVMSKMYFFDAPLVEIPEYEYKNEINYYFKTLI